METRESIKKKIERRIRRIAEKEKVLYNDIYKVYTSQFLFAKSTIEGLDKDWLTNTTEEELQELVFNFMYIGKVHSSLKLQEFGNNKNKQKDEEYKREQGIETN